MMDPEVKYALGCIEKKVDYTIVLLEEKHSSLGARVTRLEKGFGASVLLLLGSVVAYILGKH